MKKKPMIILLLIIIVIVSGFGIFLLAKNSKGPSASGEDVRLYYYRCIPGLKRAEEQENVLSVRKSFALDDKGLRIEIDRIWIGTDTAWVLYHINDGTALTPSGTLALMGTDGGTVLYTAIEEETEQIIAGDGLYGYFVMRRLDTQSITEIEQASLYPVVTRKRWRSTHMTELDAIPISLTNTIEETIQELSLRRDTHDLGSLGALIPQTITLAESQTFLHMDWESSEYDLYGMQGSLESRTGESLSLDGLMDAAGRVSLPAFNYPDSLYALTIDQVYLTCPGTLTLTIDPKDYRKRSSRQKIEQPAFQPGGAQCILDQIRVEKDWVYLDMTPVDSSNGVLSTDPWAETNGFAAVHCINGTSGWKAGTMAGNSDSLTIGIPRAMWEQDLALWVQVDMPLISYKPGLDIDLRGE